MECFIREKFQINGNGNGILKLVNKMEQEPRHEMSFRGEIHLNLHVKDRKRVTELEGDDEKNERKTNIISNNPYHKYNVLLQRRIDKEQVKVFS